jgi:hypothetical protein
MEGQEWFWGSAAVRQFPAVVWGLEFSLIFGRFRPWKVRVLSLNSGPLIFCPLPE